MKIAVLGGSGTAGAAVVGAGRKRGHEMSSCSRRNGVDVLSGEGLGEALTGADAVIDVSSVLTLSGRRSLDFFRRTTATILDTAERCGTPHVVRLSIIGVDRNPHGFYSGQLAMEEMYEASSVPSTILRAAQFHEFAAQTVERASLGPLVLVPRARIRPVAVQEVGERLVTLAEGPPQGRSSDLAGPREEDLVELVRAYAGHIGRRSMVLPMRLPVAMMRGMRRGLNLPGADVELRGGDFAEWLTEQ